MPKLPDAPTVQKEKEVATEAKPEEEIPIEEVGQEPEVSQEVAEWVKRVEKLGSEIPLPAPLTQAPQTPQITPSQTSAVVTLPLTPEEIKAATTGRHEFIEAIVWLAEWCKRILKLAHQRGLKVIFERKP